MAVYHQQFLYAVNRLGSPAELINGARTMANLARSGDNRFQDIVANCGCQALLLDPCQTTFVPPLTINNVSWGPLNTAIQQAPWFVAGVGASSEAYGFYITDWTGLDGQHHTRSSLQHVAGRGGTYFGPLTSTGRTWKLNVQLFGATERGLEYLLHWLEGQLLGCCSGDGSGSVWIREFCPTSAGVDPEEGMARGDRVVLLEGPTWEAPPIDNLGCVVRAASFALGVGDPCLYRPASSTEANLAASTSTGTTLSTAAGTRRDGTPTYPIIPYVQAPCNTFTGSGVDLTLVLPRASFGRMSGVVTITAPAESGTGSLKVVPDIRVIGHYDRSGVGQANPCFGTQRSVVILRGMLGGDVVEVDLGRRTIRRKGSINSGEWEDASYMVIQTSPLRLWSAFDSCDVGSITVEPAALDQFQGANLVSGWTVNIKAQEHYGCRC